MEHLDVLIVGAGLSGVGAACTLQNQCPWASFAIFEARHAIGGTWDLFRYPAVRSDSDMFTLGYPSPWDGELIADGASILRLHQGDGGRVGHRREHPLRPPDRPGRLVERRGPLARRGANGPTRDETGGGHL